MHSYTEAADEQGLALHGDYIYAIKVVKKDNKDNPTQEKLVRIDRNNTKEEVVMTDNGSQIVDYLHHANDMSAVEIGGELHLIVASEHPEKYEIIDLHVSGTTFAKKKVLLPFREDGKTVFKASGIHVKNDDTTLSFYIKSDKTILRADVKVSEYPKTSDLKGVNVLNNLDPGSFSIATGDFAWLKGKDGTDYNYQGFILHKNLFYVVISGAGAKGVYEKYSTILVFNMDGSKNETNTFRATASASYNKLEFESVAIAGDTGQIYINSNIDTKASNAQADAIFTYPGFVG